jgi:glycine cleavage system H lipoate-binding protein
MEGFQYIDIFSTKGFEYILVISFLILFVFFLHWMNKPVPGKSTSTIPGRSSRRLNLIDWFYLDDRYFYHQGHTWVKPEEGNLVKVGIDDFARKLVGDSVEWNLPEEGKQVHQGAKAWSVKVDGKSLSFLAPVSGHVVAINKKISRSEASLDQNPDEKDWLIQVRVPRLQAHLKNLLTGKLAHSWMQDTVEKLNHLMTADAVPVMQDGGLIKDGFLREVISQNWHEVAEEFLLSRGATDND